MFLSHLVDQFPITILVNGSNGLEYFNFELENLINKHRVHAKVVANERFFRKLIDKKLDPPRPKN